MGRLSDLLCSTLLPYYSRRAPSGTEGGAQQGCEEGGGQGPFCAPAQVTL